MRSRKRRVIVTVLVIVAVPCVVIAATAFLLFSRYVETVAVDADFADREFAAVRAGLTDRAPLIEYRGFEAPVVRRNPTAPIRELRTVHVLAYDADEGELARGAFPVGVLRTITLGGRIQLMSSGYIGGPDEPITIADLERHGPGLVLDSRSGTPGVLTVADAVLGTKSTRSRLLIWTD